MLCRPIMLAGSGGAVAYLVGAKVSSELSWAV